MKLWRNLAVAAIGLALLGGCTDDTGSGEVSADAGSGSSVGTAPVDTAGAGPDDTGPVDTAAPSTDGTAEDTTSTTVDRCFIDADGHGPDCDEPVEPMEDCIAEEEPYCGDEGLGGPDDLRFLEGWDVDGTGLDVGTTFTITCPPGGTPGPVWGTGPYSEDSSLCTAAVHLGRITVAEGGTVGGTKGEPASSFAGGTGNGITTQALDERRATIEIF